MEKTKMKITLLHHTPFLRYDGKFDLKTAREYSAKLAGECYEPEGWEKLKNESEKKTAFRENLTLSMEHQTPYEHVNIGFEAINIPKILAMVLNNERQCSTSEKSARYTAIVPNSDTEIKDLPVGEGTDKSITEAEVELYKKWMMIFRVKIKDTYGKCFDDKKIEKLAQENARYLVTVFASTKMVHTLPLIQLNRIVTYMKEYMQKENKTEFDERLIESFKEFITCLENVNVLDDKMQSNFKSRSLSLFADGPIERDEFGYSYATNYKGSFAQLAQAQRHRTLEYGMSFLEEKEFFIPPILLSDPMLVDEWLNDITSVANVNPQGELVSINELGTYSKFILKTKERLCSAAQQEIMAQTRATLLKYKDALEASEHPLAENIKVYSLGARCTFPDYNCAKSCGFKEGIDLTRKI